MDSSCPGSQASWPLELSSVSAVRTKLRESGMNPEAGNATNLVDIESKRGGPHLMWILAIASWAIGEAALILTQLHVHSSKPASIWFWYLPLAISTPLSVGAEVYKRFKRLLGEDREKILSAVSYDTALLTIVANMTITICVTSFLTSGY